MNAVWLDVPPSFLEERSRLGHDLRDELWEGVLHMVPQPGTSHQECAADLFVWLRQLATPRDYIVLYETSVYAPDVDPVSYRVPDISVASRAQRSERGLEGALIAIEIKSPSDETYEKLPFYARVGVREIWVVHRGSRIEVFALRDGAMVATDAQRSIVLDLDVPAV